MTDSHFIIGYDGEIGAAIRPGPGVQVQTAAVGKIGIDVWLMCVPYEEKADWMPFILLIPKHMSIVE